MCESKKKKKRFRFLIKDEKIAMFEVSPSDIFLFSGLTRIFISLLISLLRCVCVS